MEKAIHLGRKPLPEARTTSAVAADLAANDAERDLRPSNQSNPPKLQTTNGQCRSDRIPDMLCRLSRNDFRRKIHASRAKWIRCKLMYFKAWKRGADIPDMLALGCRSCRCHFRNGLPAAMHAVTTLRVSARLAPLCFTRMHKS
jgi:hypothetical protein